MIQGHHHNVIRPLSTNPHDVRNLLSPICNPSVWGTWGSGMGPFDAPPMGSYWLPIDTYGLTLNVFAFSWLQKRFRQSVRPSDPDAMTNAALDCRMKANACYHLFRKRSCIMVPCIDSHGWIDHDNNKTPAIYIMQEVHVYNEKPAAEETSS